MIGEVQPFKALNFNVKLNVFWSAASAEPMTRTDPCSIIGVRTADKFKGIRIILKHHIGGTECCVRGNLHRDGYLVSHRSGRVGKRSFPLAANETTTPAGSSMTISANVNSTASFFMYLFIFLYLLFQLFQAGHYLVFIISTCTSKHSLFQKWILL